ncbi:MAG: hypothetical protein J0L78_11995 [Planctomycetes bacterium]|nr:hypothetical protein [Planctomycetota bacterium]
MRRTRVLPPIALCVLSATSFLLAACQSTLSQESRRICDKYDAELAAAKAQYESNIAACESAPNPAACKDQQSQAYRDKIDVLWRAENAEHEEALQNAIHGRQNAASN